MENITKDCPFYVNLKKDIQHVQGKYDASLDEAMFILHMKQFYYNTPQAVIDKCRELFIEEGLYNV